MPRQFPGQSFQRGSGQGHAAVTPSGRVDKARLGEPRKKPSFSTDGRGVGDCSAKRTL